MTDVAMIASHIRAGTAPRNIKMFAAQGVLPIPEDDLIPLQVILTQDSDLLIVDEARNSLKKLSEEVWIRLVAKPNPDDAIMRYVLRLNVPAITEKLLLNQTLPDSFFIEQAASDQPVVLDLILNNQVRLIREPKIVQLLEANPAMTRDQRRRFDEFKTEFIEKKQKPIEKATLEDILALIPDLDPESQQIILEADAAKEERLSEEEAQKEIEKILTPDELKELPREIVSTYQKLIRMTRAERLRAALFGPKEERSFLIRDTSRQVASMVLKNPKLTDPEIENYAQMRNLDSDILRQMAGHRGFLKNYSVIHNLVRNPKTPSPISLNLLKLVRATDLKNIERDRNIPDVIRRQAKKISEMRQTERR